MVFVFVLWESELFLHSDASFFFQFILLGAVPFPIDVPRLKKLGVQGVVTLNESYETLVSTSLYHVSFLYRGFSASYV